MKMRNEKYNLNTLLIANNRKNTTNIIFLNIKIKKKKSSLKILEIPFSIKFIVPLISSLELLFLIQLV